jgi:hypothetical protein
MYKGNLNLTYVHVKKIIHVGAVHYRHGTHLIVKSAFVNKAVEFLY